ncbi:hypothetical protein GGR58DRAFT_48650 [Xylaria digitata]|nr:hypothetical protein GGR58DRAFT_48650 [Xylaria digitata]
MCRGVVGNFFFLCSLIYSQCRVLFFLIWSLSEDGLLVLFSHKRAQQSTKHKGSRRIWGIEKAPGVGSVIWTFVTCRRRQRRHLVIAAVCSSTRRSFPLLFVRYPLWPLSFYCCSFALRNHNSENPSYDTLLYLCYCSNVNRKIHMLLTLVACQRVDMSEWLEGHL